MNAITELLFNNKNPDDEFMCDFIHTSLRNAHPEEVTKIENANGGWKKYWSEVLQSVVS
jgi:hypothetical protein